MIGLKINGDDHLLLIEFTYKNSHHSSIQIAPYKNLYGIIYRSVIGWFEVGEVVFIGQDLVHQDMDKVNTIQGRLKTTGSHQKFDIDVRRRDLEFEVDGCFYLKVL